MSKSDDDLAREQIQKIIDYAMASKDNAAALLNPKTTQATLKTILGPDAEITQAQVEAVDQFTLTELQNVSNAFGPNFVN